MELNGRLKKLIEDKGVTPYEVSVDTGISQSTLSRILNKNTQKMNMKNAILLAEYFKVGKNWLMTGKGDMLKQDVEAVNEADLSQIDILLRAVDRLSASEKNNSENVKELIAQGREQTENMSKMINLLCESGISTVLKQKGGASSHSEHNNDESHSEATG